MQHYALFTVSLLATLGASITACVAVHAKRNHPFLQCRNPPFLIIQTIGATVSIILLQIDINFAPKVNCGLQYYGVLFSLVGFAIPLLLRTWEFCAADHISELKAKRRLSFFQEKWNNSVDDSQFFFKHKRLARRSFLLKILVVLMFVCSIPVALPFLPHKYYPGMRSCEFRPELFYTALGVSVVCLGAIGIFGKWVYGTKDIYKKKPEVVFLLVLWAILIVAFAFYTPIAPHIPKLLNPALVLIFGLLASLVATTSIPLFYSLRYDRELHKSKNAFFTELLESTHFRNVFHDFLSKQFCQENLQFYEVVMEWKLQQKASTKDAAARSIYETFIKAESMCQVNVEAKVRDDVAKKLELAEIPEDIFDDALAELVSDMHLSSFRLFRTESSKELARF